MPLLKTNQWGWVEGRLGGPARFSCSARGMSASMEGGPNAALQLPLSPHYRWSTASTGISHGVCGRDSIAAGLRSVNPERRRMSCPHR